MPCLYILKSTFVPRVLCKIMKFVRMVTPGELCFSDGYWPVTLNEIM